MAPSLLHVMLRGNVEERHQRDQETLDRKSDQVVGDLNQTIQAAVVCHAVREKFPSGAGGAMMHAPFVVAMFRQEVL
jgi:hypothetical protein